MHLQVKANQTNVICQYFCEIETLCVKYVLNKISLCIYNFREIVDTVAEWLRRLTRNQLG